MKKILFCLTKPLRILLGLKFIALGTIPVILIPGFGLFLGLPFLMMGACLLCK